MKEIHEGDCWGDWRIEIANEIPFLVLEAKEGKYEIDLHSIDCSAEMLDWIFQLRMKTWVTNNIIGDLASAFQDIFRPQSTLCGAGRDKKLDAKTFLQKRVKRD
jgi:hypothetical protein